MVGMSVDFLSLIERGRNSPSFKKLESMANGLGVPVAFLFTFGSDFRPTQQRSRRASGCNGAKRLHAKGDFGRFVSAELPCAAADFGGLRTVVKTSANRVGTISIMEVGHNYSTFGSVVVKIWRLAGGTILFIRKYSTICP
jgi:transcriptional regulator with XRE-family HTH domain